MTAFRKATRATARARVGFEGASGSGKTWTALQWASILGGPVALIDTERGSASLYAKHYDFDVLEMTPPYSPQRLIDAMRDADTSGYRVIVCDSISHFYSGEGGLLDIVDEVAARSSSKNSFAAWKEGTPIWKTLIDSVLTLDAHAIITMRSKTEWVIEENERGKKEPRKVGLAPEARAGLEYELTLVGTLETPSHKLTFSKSRCDQLADRVFPAGRSGEAGELFKAWLEDGEPLASRNDIDSLVSAVNAIADVETRTRCKKEFKEKFGPSTSLTVSKLAEATEFVAGFGSDDRGPSGPEGSPAEEGSAAVGSGEDGGTARPARRTRTPAQQLHIDTSRMGLTEGDLDAAILNQTLGRTQSAAELDDIEVQKVRTTLRDMAADDERRLAIVAVAAEHVKGASCSSST